MACDDADACGGREQVASSSHGGRGHAPSSAGRHRQESGGRGGRGGGGGGLALQLSPVGGHTARSHVHDRGATELPQVPSVSEVACGGNGAVQQTLLLQRPPAQEAQLETMLSTWLGFDWRPGRQILVF